MPGNPRLPEAGELLAHYRLVELENRDNVSRYRAVDSRTNTLARLTVSATRFSIQEVRQLLSRAGVAVAAEHANLERIYEGGETDGRIWVASEYLDGAPIERLLRERGAFPTRVAARYAGSIAAGLAAAHRSGLRHLGLRPANVLVAGEKIKVLDLGVSVLFGADGRGFATPAFLAPEQVDGSQLMADDRTDVYALGALVYQMLTGIPPFGGNSFQEIANGILHDSPRELVALKPRAKPLEAIVRRALEKQPAARFQTMGEFALALGEVVSAPVDEIEEDDEHRFATGASQHRRRQPAEPVNSTLQATWGVADRSTAPVNDGATVARKIIPLSARRSDLESPPVESGGSESAEPADLTAVSAPLPSTASVQARSSVTQNRDPSLFVPQPLERVRNDARGSSNGTRNNGAIVVLLSIIAVLLAIEVLVRLGAFRR